MSEKANFPLEDSQDRAYAYQVIQRLRADVAVVTLSVPARYIHSVNEIVTITNTDRSVTLLASYLHDVHTREQSAIRGRASPRDRSRASVHRRRGRQARKGRRIR